MQESIWADGCPQNVDEKMKLTVQDLMLMGIDFFIKKYAIPNGFKIEQTNAKLSLLPNVIMKKDGLVYGIAIVPFVYPKYGMLTDGARISMVKTLKEQNVIPLFAPIGFISTDKDRAKAEMALKGDLFNIMFRGFIELNDSEHQNLAGDIRLFKML